MDGLTIRNSQRFLDTGKTASEIRTEDFQMPHAPGASQKSGDVSFADTLKDAIGQVNTMQKEADFKAQQLATGRTDNIQDVMVTAEKADIALRLMTNVRNKVIDAYQEIMKLQV